MTPIKLKRKIAAVGATLALSLGAVATVAEPAAAGKLVEPGSATAGMLYYQATFTLSGSGTTNGWSKGTIKIYGYLYQPNNSLDRAYTNTCANSTWCTLPTFAFCPAIPGVWRYVVTGNGPGGSDSDTAVATVL
jgi:hypothetical protein